MGLKVKVPQAMGSRVRGYQDFMHSGVLGSPGSRVKVRTLRRTLSRRLLADTVLHFFLDLRTMLARAAQASVWRRQRDRQMPPGS